jgi:cobalamin transport system substrate-binding protein
VPPFRCNRGPCAILLVFALLFLCVEKVTAQGNTNANAAKSTAAQPNTHEVVDEVGRTVRVPLLPTRIVSLAPNLTETVYALGLQDRLVGDTDYCDYPPEAQKKPKVGGAINPNLEQIAALRPDLVLVTKDLNRLDTVRALDTLGIPSYSTDAAHTIDGIISSTERLADILGAAQAGKVVGDDLHHRLATLQEKLRSAPATHVLFVVWTEPLISAGKNTFIADALRKAGAISIVDSTQDWPQMNLEEVVRLQPDYLVFAAAHAAEGMRDFEALVNRPGWHLLDAVRNRHYAVVSDAVNRPAPRIVSAIEDLAHQLHPASFQDSPSPEKEIVPTNSTSPAHPPHAELLTPDSFAGACVTESACAL